MSAVLETPAVSMLMKAIDIAAARGEPAEGYRQKKYLDSRGFESIGIGFNITAGISHFAAVALFKAQLQERAEEMTACWWAKGLDDVRMSVVVEVAFNVGVSGLLHYVNTLAAIGRKDWKAAHDELLDSDAARELPSRYNRLAAILLTGTA
jgi:lysozyme